MCDTNQYQELVMDELIRHLVTNYFNGKWKLIFMKRGLILKKRGNINEKCQPVYKSITFSLGFFSLKTHYQIKNDNDSSMYEKFIEYQCDFNIVQYNNDTFKVKLTVHLHCLMYDWFSN